MVNGEWLKTKTPMRHRRRKASQNPMGRYLRFGLKVDFWLLLMESRCLIGVSSQMSP